jgi:isocitrate lyase
VQQVKAGLERSTSAAGEFASEECGYTATQHQREVGRTYFDEVAETPSGGDASTKALSGSTEEAQFD